MASEDDEERRRHLAIECRYLDSALSRLTKRNTGEYDYLYRKRSAALDELDELIRRGAATIGGGPRGDDDELDDELDDGDDRGVGNGSGMLERRMLHPPRMSTYYRDDVVVDDGGVGVGDGVDWEDDDSRCDPGGRQTAHHPDGDYLTDDGGDDDDDDDDDDDVSKEEGGHIGGRPLRPPPRRGDDDDDDDDEAASSRRRRRRRRVPHYSLPRATLVEGWTPFQNLTCIAVGLMSAILIVSTLLVALTRGGGEESASTQGTADSSTSSYQHQFAEPCASFSLHLIPDKFGNETLWKVMRYDGSGAPDPRGWRDDDGAANNWTAVSSGGPYAYRDDFDSTADGGGGGGGGIDIGNRYEMIEADTCLPVGSYVFALYDVGGDGMCCDYGRGEYGINLSSGRTGTEIRPLSSGKFTGHVDATFFVVSDADVDVRPPAPPPAAADDGGVVAAPHAAPGPLSAEVPCALFAIHLVLDQFGNETSWDVVLYADDDGGGDDANLGTYYPTYYPTANPVNVGTRYLKSPSDYDDATPLRRKTQEGSSPSSSGETTTTVVLLSGGPYYYKPDFESDAIESHYDAVVAESCLPVGSYDFALYDVGGDGICCDYGRGEYGIEFANGRVVRPLSRGEFAGASEVTPFEVTVDDLDFFPAEEHPEEEGAVAEDGEGEDDHVPIVTTDGVGVYPAEGGGGAPSPAAPVGGVAEEDDLPIDSASNTSLVDAGGSTDDTEVSAAVTNVSVITAFLFCPFFVGRLSVCSFPSHFSLEPGHYRRYDQQPRDGVGYRRHDWSRKVLRSPLRRKVHRNLLVVGHRRHGFVPRHDVSHPL